MPSQNKLACLFLAVIYLNTEIFEKIQRLFFFGKLDHFIVANIFFAATNWSSFQNFLKKSFMKLPPSTILVGKARSLSLEWRSEDNSFTLEYQTRPKVCQKPTRQLICRNSISGEKNYNIASWAPSFKSVTTVIYMRQR